MKRVVYWDSDAFLQIINRDGTAEQLQGCDDVWAACQKGTTHIVTSTLTVAEVIHKRGEVAMTKAVWGDRMTYGPFEETTANARLIVAAPDLLNVLLRMVEYADDGTPIHPTDNLMAEARAVVAQAVGAA